jgi:hypothetical protein
MQGIGNRDQGLGMTKKIMLLGALSMLAFTAGCRQDMQDQPKFFSQRGTSFYADGRSARPQVEGTVARGQLHEDNYFYTGMVGSGKDGGKEGDVMPFPVTMEVLERGQERFNIYCTACHSRVGNGAGMIVQRGYKPAGNFHEERLLSAPLGHFFNVMTHGYGAMPDYAAQLTPADRWAVAAYIRALQLSQNAKPTDVATGGHVEQLSDVAQHDGLPATFADEWTLPATAVYGTPDGKDDAIPTLATPAGRSAAAAPAATK